MNQLQFGFIGWMKEGTSDKIWGWCIVGEKPVEERNAYSWNSPVYGQECWVFWGRRGKSVQFKKDIVGHTLRKLVDSKLDKGYRRISLPRLVEMVPDFQEKVEAKLMFRILMGV